MQTCASPCNLAEVWLVDTSVMKGFVSWTLDRYMSSDKCRSRLDDLLCRLKLGLQSQTSLWDDFKRQDLLVKLFEVGCFGLAKEPKLVKPVYLITLPRDT